MKVAYLDCFSGISGDMLLGALLDAGVPLEKLETTLRTLPLEGYSLEMRREGRSDLFGTRFLVHVEKDKQTHRGLGDITRIIEGGRLSTGVKTKSLEIFEAIARVEGKIHNRPPESIHFHEVGAVDSIIDVVGSLLGLEILGVAQVFASSLPLGSGFVTTGHGRIPVPAPATLALLEDIPVYDAGLKFELVTPTGAALVKTLARSFGAFPPMKIETVGYGVGSRDLPDRPNLLRIVLGMDHSEEEVETVVILEANMDDTNPEWLGFLMDRLFREGALDVVFCPVQMKKNRPGVLIQIIGKPHHKERLMDILFRESTTLGVRFRYSQRKALRRSFVEVDSPWGKMRVKKVLRPDGSPHFHPEYEACRKIAEEKGIPIRDVYHWVVSFDRG